MNQGSFQAFWQGEQYETISISHKPGFLTSSRPWKVIMLITSTCHFTDSPLPTSERAQLVIKLPLKALCWVETDGFGIPTHPIHKQPCRFLCSIQILWGFVYVGAYSHLRLVPTRAPPGAAEEKVIQSSVWRGSRATIRFCSLHMKTMSLASCLASRTTMDEHSSTWEICIHMHSLIKHKDNSPWMAGSTRSYLLKLFTTQFLIIIWFMRHHESSPR